MKEDFDKLLSEIDVEIAKIDLYGNDIIETSLSIVRHLQSIITGLRNELQTYTFPTQEDEIRFFKVQKPELLGRLLYFHKICRIEMQCPNGSNEVIRKHLIAELDNLTYFFNRNLDFYQYYRSKSTYLDRYYFTRNQNDLRICTDSSHIDKDPLYSTGYDFKVAKIITNELLKIYLTNRLQELERIVQRKADNGQVVETILRWTGPKRALVGLIYALEANGDFNKGTATLKEIAGYLEHMFSIDVGNLHHSYLTFLHRQHDFEVKLPKASCGTGNRFVCRKSHLAAI